MVTSPASHPAPNPSFRLGTTPVFGRCILAPMDGVSDWPFRSICRSFGSAMSYTAFVAAHEVIAGQPRALQPLHFTPDERPIVFQIFDDDEGRLLEAALRLQERRPDGIDINMGCSARCVSGRGAGAGLLRDPAKVGRILSRLSAALEVPVGAKIRLGWDDGSRNYRIVARAVEDNGGSWLAVHGRTRAQGYSGEADWEAIADVKASVRIPVLGNGDIRTPAEAARRLAESGCEAVLIGRAAMGHPWIFQGRTRAEVSRLELAAVMDEHLRRMLAYHGERDGVVLFRKHLKRYLDDLDLPSESRRLLLTQTDAEALRRELVGVGLPVGAHAGHQAASAFASTASAPPG